MKTSDFTKPLSSIKLRENLEKQFNTRVNLENYDRVELEDIRNKLRTRIFQQESSAKVNELLTNEAYQKDKAMLELLNTKIKEMLGEAKKAGKKPDWLLAAQLKAEKKAGKIEEDNEIPIAVRSLYTKMYAKHGGTASQAKAAEAKAYAEVEKKYGKEMADKLKAYHKSNVTEEFANTCKCKECGKTFKVAKKGVKLSDCGDHHGLRAVKVMAESEYSDKNPKFDIYVDGKYVASTNWASTAKEAKEGWISKHPADASKKISITRAEKQGVAEGKNQEHEYNLDAAQREMDRREAQGEDMTGAKIDPKTYEIIKPKKQHAAESLDHDDIEDDKLYVIDTKTHEIVSGPYDNSGEIPLRLMGYDGGHKVLSGDDLKMMKHQGMAESIIYSDRNPRLSGLSFSDLDRLSESAGDNYKKFNEALMKNLNLPSWVNTLEIFGVYLRKLDENKSGKLLVEEEQSDIENQLFSELDKRTFGSVDSATVGDKVSLLHLSTLNIPGHKVVAKLNGFLEPKEIVKINKIGQNQQLEFSDGTRYPDNDSGDVFQMTQGWNMTKLFPTRDSASKVLTLYALVGEKMSSKLDFNIAVDQAVEEDLQDRAAASKTAPPTQTALARKMKDQEAQAAAQQKTLSRPTKFDEESEDHPDEKEDKALIRKMVKPDCMKRGHSEMNEDYDTMELSQVKNTDFGTPEDRFEMSKIDLTVHYFVDEAAPDYESGVTIDGIDFIDENGKKHEFDFSDLSKSMQYRIEHEVIQDLMSQRDSHDEYEESVNLRKHKMNESKKVFKQNVKIVNESIKALLAEDKEEEAKTITAAGDIVNDFTSWANRLGQYGTKVMIDLSDAITKEPSLGPQKAKEFRNVVEPALTASLDMLTRQREVISNAVAVLAGSATADSMMGAEPPMTGDEDEMGPMEPGMEPSAADQMNEPEDEFSASDAAGAGREMRESSYNRKLRESHSILTKLASK